MKRWYYLLLLSLPLNLLAQLDTMVVYDLASQSVEIIPPVDFDPSVTFDFSNSSTGSMGSVTNLSLVPPTTNLFNNSEFSRLAPASDLFNVTDYPIRTAMRLFSFKEGDTSFVCSGMLVGENMVLTSTFCIFDIGTDGWLADSIVVVPAFDNGIPQSSLPTTIVEKFIIFKETFDDGHFINLALLKLSEPIGKELGWTGIAFAEDDFFADKVMHKLSYADEDPFFFQPYNGDTLYYNYGLTDVLLNGSLGVTSNEARGLIGQGGSTFLYTDNTDYYNFGTLFWSNNYNHERIEAGWFYQMKNAIESFVVASTGPVPDPLLSLSITPNPFHQTSRIEFPNPNALPFHFQLFDVTGRLTKELDGNGEWIEIDRKGLSNGTYIFQISGLTNQPVSGKIMVQ